ncbi:hypothetical protein [Rhodoferax saidenbachensis]|uniref:Uncharacterized protein n=1 Tax=Rhodoferax saidenbachensis TaxID=1484693 RepID=A0A1P8K5D5_9BURK|nr:hypothetical protein [Rhodoferax saidenbachensis]APW41209.1 hypothetical protein RS694_00720 [Rhodoferax saidenbachensis]
MQGATRPTSLQQVRAAVQANLVPGLVLWCGLAVLLMAYAWSPAVQAGLAQWGAVKRAWGYPFSFASYVVFAVLVPEALSHVVLKQRWTRGTWGYLFYATLVFGCIGISVDMLYALQVQLFGEGSDVRTIGKKMLFDQFVYSPVSNYVMVVAFAWREGAFSASTLRRLVSADYFSRHYLPVLIAVWCVWIPGVLVIYFMPTALQFPVANIILSFWVLIFKFMRKG